MRIIFTFMLAVVAPILFCATFVGCGTDDGIVAKTTSSPVATPNPTPTPSYEVRKNEEVMRLRRLWQDIQEAEDNGYDQSYQGYEALSASYDEIETFGNQFFDPLSNLTDELFVTKTDVGVDEIEIRKIKAKRLKKLVNYLIAAAYGTKPLPIISGEAPNHFRTQLDAAEEAATLLVQSHLSIADVGITNLQVRNAVRSALRAEIQLYNSKPSATLLERLQDFQNRYGFDLKAMGLKEAPSNKKE